MAKPTEICNFDVDTTPYPYSGRLNLEETMAMSNMIAQILSNGFGINL